MSSINDTLGDIAKSIKKRKAARAAASRATALPQDALERAVIILEDDAAFSDNETMEVIDMFMADREVARVYASLQTAHTRTNLVMHHLAKLWEGSA
jgi:hypothetical protein